MSLAETQQIFILLTEINKLLDAIIAKTETTEKRVTQTTASLKNFRQILSDSLILSRRLGLDDDLSNAAVEIQRMILLTYQLNTALSTLNFATPAGALVSTLGLAVTAFTYADAITYDSRG